MKFVINAKAASRDGFVEITDKVEAKSSMFAIIKFLVDLRLTDTQQIESIKVKPARTRNELY